MIIYETLSIPTHIIFILQENFSEKRLVRSTYKHRFIKTYPQTNLVTKIILFDFY